METVRHQVGKESNKMDYSRIKIILSLLGAGSILNVRGKISVERGEENITPPEW